MSRLSIVCEHLLKIFKASFGGEIAVKGEVFPHWGLGIWSQLLLLVEIVVMEGQNGMPLGSAYQTVRPDTIFEKINVINL